MQCISPKFVLVNYILTALKFYFKKISWLFIFKWKKYCSSIFNFCVFSNKEHIDFVGPILLYRSKSLPN